MKVLINLKRSIILLFALLICVCSNAQDIRFTQPFAVPSKLNPASLGGNNDLKAMINYRNQWAGIEDGYQTYNFTFLYPLFLGNGNQKIDFGLLGLSDQAGAWNTLDISLSIGYKLKLTESNHNLSLALVGGFVQKSLDAANLTYDDQYVAGSFTSVNPTSETIVTEKLGYPDIGTGLMWFYNPSREDAKINGWFGISAFHINQPNESFTGETSKLPMKIGYQTGIRIFSNSGLDFTPNVRVTTQASVTEVSPGLYVDYNLADNKGRFVFGSWYRQGNAFAFLLGFEHNYFTIGYSYDLGISTLNQSVSGLMVHEATIGYRIDWGKKRGLELNASPFSPF